MFISRSRILPARRACAALIPAVCVGGLSVKLASYLVVGGGDKHIEEGVEGVKN